jgi:hypothetical protein
MRTMTKWMTRVAVVVILVGGPMSVFAAPPFVLPQGPPVWCFGLNEFDQCTLYLGSAESCQNIQPCSAPSLGLPSSDLTLCFGADDVTGECRLFLGTEERCASLEPCRAIPGLLPQPGKLGAPTGPR